MDFVKKFAQEQLEKQMGGNQNQGNQQHNQGQGQNSGYGSQQSGGQGGFGDLINSFTGGQQQQQQHHQGGQQQNYGGQQNYEGQQNYGGQEERYGNQGENYGGQGQNYGGQQENYGGQGDYDGGRQSGGFGVTGGSQYNAPHGSGGASSFGGGAGGVPNINQNEALQAANQHAGNGNENASLFSSAFSFIQGMNKDDNDIDEDDVQQKHEKAYGQGQAGNMSASAIGSAAALQAIKQFTSGSSGAAGGSTNKGGNDMVSKIIGMALSEAAKLFDKSGGAATGTKEDAVTSAGQTVMKLLLKNQVSGMMGGGQSGGLGSLMSMASKFM